eukprot:gene1871-2299_t
MTERSLEKAVNDKMSAQVNTIKMQGKDVTVHYGEKQALFGVSLDVPEKMIGGKITLDDEDIYNPKIDVVELRARVGMVFQKPNPFPKSIFENVAYGPRIHGLAKNRHELEEIVEKSLRRASLFDEQAARVSQRTAMFHLGNLVEVGDTEMMFTNPTEKRTQDYITGRFG